MSDSSRSRRKRKLEPISIEELAGTTGMSGFCTFLTRDTSVSVPALEGIVKESSAPLSGAPFLAAPLTAAPDSTISTAPDTSASESGAGQSGAPVSDAGEIGAVDSSDSSALEWTPRRRSRVRETTTVQDGHSLAEQAVYDAMYRVGKPYQGDSRILTIGLRTLAEIARMAYSNCKANVRSLVEKLAIDERDGFTYTEGRTYIVYSFREILRRRKAAGLTHVIRTRGVAFVDPSTGKPLADKRLPESSAPVSSAGQSSAPVSLSGALVTIQSGAPEPAESSAPAADALLRNRHWIRNPEEPSSSSALAAVIAALRSHIPDVDDEGAWLLWQRCRENAPLATAEEVIHFVHLKAGKTGIRMPFGFLLTAVPKCFLGDSYRQFREERQRQLAGGTTRDRLFAEEILKSPDADEEQKEWAREVLEGSSQVAE